MRVVIQKWGNSLAVRVPRAFASETGIIEGSEVEITLDDGGIFIHPAAPRYRLEDLVAGITPDNMHGEVNPGASVGGEAW